VTERVCPTCMGEGVVEVEDEDLEEGLEGEEEMVPIVHHQPCPLCGGEGTVEE